MRILAALIVLFVSPLPATADVKPDQWIYREVDGWPGPVASFLSWNYDTVLFHFYCDGDVLVMSYVGESDIETHPDWRDRPLAFVFAEGVELKLDTERKEGVRVGRLKLTPGVTRALLAAPGLAIEAGLEMGIPWGTGEAAPLKQLIRRCVADL